MVSLAWKNWPECREDAANDGNRATGTASFNVPLPTANAPLYHLYHYHPLHTPADVVDQQRLQSWATQPVDSAVRSGAHT